MTRSAASELPLRLSEKEKDDETLALDCSRCGTARRLRSKDAALSVEELVESGSGWVTDGPLSRDEIVNTYNGFRSEEITDEQAARHAKAAATVDAEYGIADGW